MNIDLLDQVITKINEVGIQPRYFETRLLLFGFIPLWKIKTSKRYHILLISNEEWIDLLKDVSEPIVMDGFEYDIIGHCLPGCKILIYQNIIVSVDYETK